MISFFYRLFNKDKIDRLNERIKSYEEIVEGLEAEVREYKGYKLKYRVTKLYVEDDEALLELFEIAEKNEKYRVEPSLSYASHQQQAAFRGNLGQLAGLGLIGANQLSQGRFL